MPLFDPIQLLNARIAADATDIAAHLAAASRKANGIVSTLLELEDSALTSWLNSQTPEETQALFGAHAQLGEALNAATATAAGVLAASGIQTAITLVDTRSVPEKLASKGRIFAFDGSVFSVSTPPPPEPEPVPEA